MCHPKRSCASIVNQIHINSCRPWGIFLMFRLLYQYQPIDIDLQLSLLLKSADKTAGASIMRSGIG